MKERSEKEYNNKHIRLLLELLVLVAVCVTSFVIFRENTKTNAKDIDKNCVMIEKNGTSIKALSEMHEKDYRHALEERAKDRLSVATMKGDIKSAKDGIARIEKKL